MKNATVFGGLALIDPLRCAVQAQVHDSLLEFHSLLRDPKISVAGERCERPLEALRAIPRLQLLN